MKPRNVQEAIRIYGHDEDFAPTCEAEPTPHAPGTVGKVEAMRKRVELGLPIWNSKDNDTHGNGSSPILRGPRSGYRAMIREYRLDGDFCEFIGGIDDE